MTGHVIVWFCLASAIACVSLGVVRLVAWSSAQRLRRLDADYRAFAMIAQAKREVRRRDAELMQRAWDMQRDCNCDDCVQGRRDAELERAVCALEAQWGARRA